MEKRERQELLEILSNNKGNLYDFVCNNYYLLSKDDLKDIAKEVIYLLYTYVARANSNNPEKGEQEAHAELLESLKENTTIFED